MWGKGKRMCPPVVFVVPVVVVYVRESRVREKKKTEMDVDDISGHGGMENEEVNRKKSYPEEVPRRAPCTDDWKAPLLLPGLFLCREGLVYWARSTLLTKRKHFHNNFHHPNRTKEKLN